MSEILGTARVLLSVDSTDFEARIARSKNLAASFGADAEAAFGKVDAKTKRSATSLLRYAETIGKTADETKLFNAAASGVPLPIIEAAAGKINQMRVATEQAAEAARAYSAEQSFIRSLQQQALALDKTRAEMLELKAAEMGLSAQAAPFIARLKQQEAALRTSGVAFNEYGLSVKQTQAALRQVPAQLTDIIVSLQGGQAPLTVLLQQGGQLRDIFGGIRPALTALGSAALGLFTPVTVLAAAVAGLGAAFFAGSQEASEFGKAIAASGNRAGATIGQLQNLSAELDNIGGVTQGKAAAVLAEVVRSGRIGADQLELVARAAIALEQVSGKAIGDTVSQFEELRKSPTEAVLKLNESLNFLTDSQFAQIRALEQAGDVQAAATLATRIAADAAIEAAEGVRENLGYLETAWKAVTETAGEAWDAMKGIGRAQTAEEELASLEESVRSLRDRLGELADAPIDIEALNSRNFSRAGDQANAAAQQALRQNEARIEELRAEIAASAEANEDARIRQGLERQLVTLQATQDRYATDAERRARERATIETNAAKAVADAVAIGDAELIRLAEERGRNALAAFDRSRSQEGGTASIANAEMRRQIEAVKAALEAERAEIGASKTILEAEYRAKLVPAEDYYERLRGLIARDVEAQEDALVAELAILRSRSATGRDAIEVQTNIIKVEGDLAKLRADSATAAQVLAIEEAALARTREQALNAYIQSLDANNEALAMRTNAEIAAIGRGSLAAQRERELSEVYRDQAEELRELARARDEGGSQEDYDARVEALQRATDERVRIVVDGYSRMDAAQANWLNGVSAGVENWIAETSNVAAQIESITTNSFRRVGDAIADAAMTGKLEWRDMLADILAQIVRFLAQQAVLNFIKAAAGGTGGGGGGGFWGTLFGAFTANAKGNVYDSPSLSQYRNEVHNTPKLFAFAKGAGVFGEAGYEAIMPLTRGPDGNLGVRAQGGSGGGISISVSTVVNTDGSSSTQTQSSGGAGEQQAFEKLTNTLAGMVKTQLTTEMRPGGVLYKVGVQQR